MTTITKTPASSKQHFIAGITAGATTAATVHPIDLIKVRYQVYDKSGNAYRSLFSAFRTIVKEEGTRGLFQGLTPAVLASAVSWGGYMYFYELAKKRKLNSDSSIDKLDTIDHLLSGVEAGVCMVFITNPLWLIKTRLQIQHRPLVETSTVVAETNTYKGLLDAVKVIYREEGFIGYYRGIVPALFLTSHGAVQFAVYEQFKSAYKVFQGHGHHEQPAFVSMTTGVMSKMVASTLTYPYQVIKSRLQQRGSLQEVTLSNGEVKMVPQAKYTGVVDCAQQIIRKEGFKGFFRGLIPNCLKVAPGAAVTFLVYEESLKLLRKFHIAQ